MSKIPESDADRHWKFMKKIIIGIVIMGVIIIFVFFYVSSQQSVIPSNESISRFELRTNGTGNEIDSFWIEFKEYKDNAFMSPNVQKQFDNCHYSEGSFRYYSDGERYECYIPTKEFILK